MTIEKMLSKRLRVVYDGSDYRILDVNLIDNPHRTPTVCILTHEEAWLLKLWISDLKDIWSIENMGDERAAPIIDEYQEILEHTGQYKKSRRKKQKIVPENEK